MTLDLNEVIVNDFHVNGHAWAAFESLSVPALFCSTDYLDKINLTLITLAGQHRIHSVVTCESSRPSRIIFGPYGHLDRSGQKLFITSSISILLQVPRVALIIGGIIAIKLARMKQNYCLPCLVTT